MSSSKRFTRVVAVALSGVGTAAIIASAAIGLAGWPPAKATAAPAARQGVLGVGDRVSGPATPLAVENKIGVPDESRIASPTAPTQRRMAPLPRHAKAAKVAVRTTVAKKARKLHRSRSLKALGKGWRQARVSWYGPGFYGHTMAGGGTLRPTSMVVAHRSLPFGTRIEFKYKGRSVIATVRDRGPYVSGRTFDLGPGTAHALGFSGVGTVSYRIIGR